MAGVDIIDNSDEVLSNLDGSIKRAMVKCGIIAEGYAKLLCPYVTGRLRGSIVYATSTKQSTGQFPAKGEDYRPMGTPEKNTVYIGTNVEYAPMVELGTARRRAHPFLRPAFENHSNEYATIINAELKGQ